MAAHGKGLTLEKIVEDFILWMRPCAGGGEACEEEGPAETMYNKLTTLPICHTLVPLKGEG